MYLKDRIKKLEKLASDILVNGDKFSIQKDEYGITVEAINEDRAKKFYKTRAILRKYNSKTYAITGMIHVILFFCLLSLFILIANDILTRSIGVNLSFLNHWFVYAGIIFLYMYFILKLRSFLLRIYIFFKWKGIHSEFNYLGVDSSFL